MSNCNCHNDGHYDDHSPNLDEKRLSDYKWGDRTYDDVLNVLMDRVPLEDISREQIREHYRRLKTFEGVSREEFKAKVKVKHLSGS